MRRQEIALSDIKSPGKTKKQGINSKTNGGWDQNIKSLFTRTNSPPIQLLHKTRAIRDSRHEIVNAERILCLQSLEEQVLTVQKVNSNILESYQKKYQDNIKIGGRNTGIILVSQKKKTNRSELVLSHENPTRDTYSRNSVTKEYRLKKEKSNISNQTLTITSNNTNNEQNTNKQASTRLKKKGSKSLLNKINPSSSGGIPIVQVGKSKMKKKTGSIRVTSKFFSNIQL